MTICQAIFRKWITGLLLLIISISALTGRILMLQDILLQITSRMFVSFKKTIFKYLQLILVMYLIWISDVVMIIHDEYLHHPRFRDSWSDFYVWSEVKVAQLCPTLCNPMDYIVHGILQARILEWVAFPFSRDLPNPGIKPRSPALQVDSLPAETHWYLAFQRLMAILNTHPLVKFWLKLNISFDKP